MVFIYVSWLLLEWHPCWSWFGCPCRLQGSVYLWTCVLTSGSVSTPGMLICFNAPELDTPELFMSLQLEGPCRSPPSQVWSLTVGTWPSSPRAENYFDDFQPCLRTSSFIIYHGKVPNPSNFRNTDTNLCFWVLSQKDDGCCPYPIDHNFSEVSLTFFRQGGSKATVWSPEWKNQWLESEGNRRWPGLWH